jgi:AraC-like DNA-binding protein/ligand-binding sensor protein
MESSAFFKFFFRNRKGFGFGHRFHSGGRVMKKNSGAKQKDAHGIIDSLSQSAIFQEYQHAFCGATGLPLALTDATSQNLPFSGQPMENSFCALVAQTEEGCAACLEFQKRLASKLGDVPVTLRCFAGLSHTVIPVKLGDKVLGCLHTGQVFLSEPTRKSFNRTARLLLKWGMKTDMKRIESAYFGIRILTPKQYEAMLSLLSVFARHLSEVGNRIVVESTKLLPTMIEDAQHYIQEHQQEPLTLTEVAKRVNVSTQYLSSLFHQASGITFTDYVARLRVEQAKVLLADPRNRISEVAFAVGFESLSQFNRVFRRVVGHAPTKFRSNLPQAKTRV